MPARVFPLITYGAGIRVGLYERYQDNAGSLYLMLGYVKTELEGQGTITNVNDAIILSIPQQDLDFTGTTTELVMNMSLTRAGRCGQTISNTTTQRKLLMWCPAQIQTTQFYVIPVALN